MHALVGGWATHKPATQFALTRVTQTKIAQADRVGWIIRPVFNKQQRGCDCCPACSTWINDLLHILGSAGPSMRSENEKKRRSSLCLTSLPAPHHITAGHRLNWFEALLYVYPIIFLCHDHKAVLPRSVQFNFSMGPRW